MLSGTALGLLLDGEAVGPHVGEALREAKVGNGDKFELREYSDYSVLPQWRSRLM